MGLLDLSINPDTETSRLIPLCHRKMPNFTFAIPMRVSLDFTAEEISGEELDWYVFPLVFYIRRNIVVDDVAAAPSPKFSRFQ
jgi:hypothetical protein